MNHLFETFDRFDRYTVDGDPWQHPVVLSCPCATLTCDVDMDSAELWRPSILQMTFQEDGCFPEMGGLMCLICLMSGFRWLHHEHLSIHSSSTCMIYQYHGSFARRERERDRERVRYTHYSHGIIICIHIYIHTYTS